MANPKKRSVDDAPPNTLSASLPQTHTQRPVERNILGKALRERATRKAQAEWKPPANRADPVDLLIENSQGRIEGLIPIRYGRMSVNPFAFYRGAAAIMAYDLAHTPSTGLNIQICGDCHLLNFCGFATAERKLIFDINDFDETSVAPWEWDVKRLATSFVIAGRSNGFDEADSREAAWLCAQSYRRNIAGYAAMPVLQAWYDALDLTKILASIPDKKDRNFYTKKLDKAIEQGAHEKEFAKLAMTTGGSPRIIDQPPLIFHFGDIESAEIHLMLERSIADYRTSLSPERGLLLNRYQLVDVAFKVVGVGSVGTNCGIALYISGDGDPLFLQFKEARKSVLESYAGASPYTHAGQRVVVGQRLMQAAGDLFLGWYTGMDKYRNKRYYIRQLSDVKIKPVVEIMQPSDLKDYGRLTGRALARAHVRSGDAVVLSAYMGKNTSFEDALADFSVAYADQNERDHAALIDAIRAGRVEARMVE